MSEWKSIYAHKWGNTTDGDTLYNKAIQYIKNNKSLESKHFKSMNSDQKSYFTKRMKRYNYSIKYLRNENFKENDENINESKRGAKRPTKDEKEEKYTIVLVYILDKEEHIPAWLSYSYTDLPITFTVVNPKDIEETIHGFTKDMIHKSGNYKTLYDKIIRAKYLGISRSDVVEYLKTKPIERHQLIDIKTVKYVKSYRPKYPFHYWQIDHINFDKLEKGKAKKNKGYNHVLVIIDIFSKYVYLFPCKTKAIDKHDNPEVADILQKIFLSGDIPERLGADGAFTPLKGLCETFGVQLRIGLPYSPQTQGFVENKNKQIKNLIAHHFSKYSTYTFYNILDHIAFTINNTKHSVTNMTPFELHKGRGISITPSSYLIDKDLVEHIEHNDEFEKEDVKHYKKTSRFLHESRVNHARQLIHNAADKREAKMAKKNERKDELKEGDNILIYAFLDLGSQVQPTMIQLVNRNDKSIHKLINPLVYFARTDPVLSKDFTKQKLLLSNKKLPKSLFPSLLLKSRKFEWKFPPSFKSTSSILGNFKIISRDNKTKDADGISTQTKRSWFYTIEYDDGEGNKYDVQKMIKKQTDEYNNFFTSEYIFHSPVLPSKPKEKLIEYKPEFGYIPTVPGIAIKYNVKENMMVDKIKKNPSYAMEINETEKIDDNPNILHSKTLALFETNYQKYQKKIQELDIFNGIKLYYVFEYTDKNDNTIVDNHILKASIGIDKDSNWIGKKYQQISDLNTNGWIKTRKVQKKTWHIFYDDGDESYERLNPDMYDRTLLDFKNNYNKNPNKPQEEESEYKMHNWCFAEPYEVEKLLLSL